jgi:serine/threonine-protein kinase
MDKGRYLDCWKDIAAYLNRNVRTCQTWERELGLPIHRLDGSPRARVFAYAAELDAWRDEKGHLPDNVEAGTEDEESTSLLPRPKTVKIRRLARAWLVAALVGGPVLAAVATGLVIRHLRPAPTSAVGRFIIKVEPGHWLDGMRNAQLELQRPSRTAMAISKDGRFVIYSAIEENPGPQSVPRLFLRRMDQSEAKPIAGTEGGVSPFLSPDDRWVGFWADRKLKKIPVEGGVASALCDVSMVFGANWGPNNIIAFADGYQAGLATVSADGGKRETLTVPDTNRQEASHRLPSWLPGGNAVLFTVLSHSWDSQPSLAVLRMDTHAWRVLLPDAADARYVPTGHLVFLKRGILMAARFDLAKLEILGQPSPLVEDVAQAVNVNTYYNSGAGQFDISETGSLIYARGGVVPDQKNSLVWVDQVGNEQPVTDLRLPFCAPRLSPDGQKIAYDSVGAREDRIYVYDPRKGTNTPLTSEGGALFATWTPGGGRLIFGWLKTGVPNLFWQPPDGGSPMERLTSSEYQEFGGTSSPDGRTIALVEVRSGINYDIALLDVRSRRLTPFLNSQFEEAYPEFSPDGHWIAYTSNESKRYEVFVRAFPGQGRKLQVSNGGGREPLWARDGRRLFYRWGDRVWVADIRTDGELSASKPRLLFEKSGYWLGHPMRGYDLSLDGQRFLMVKLDDRKPTPITEMILVQNWFEELKRLVPASRR